MKHTSLLLRASILTSIATVTLMNGCSGGKDAPPSGDPEKPIPLLAGVDAPKPVLNSLDRTDDAGTDALARTTTSYADQMEQMLAARAAEVAARRVEEPGVAAEPVTQEPAASNQPATVAAEPELAPKPSAVEFAEAGALPIVSEPQPQPAPARVRTIARTDSVLAPATAPPLAENAENAELAANVATNALSANSVSANAAQQPETAPDADSALERKFAERVKDYPRDVAAHLDYQLLQFVNDKSVPDLNTIAALPVEDREMVTALLDGLSNFRSIVRADNNTLLSKKIAPVVEMADRMRAQANLSIPTAALCTSVQQFGVYTPVATPRFVCGAENQVILYCEVANFASHLNGKGTWETKLTYETSLYTDNEAGMPVWQGKPTPITDECRNRRRDFFLADKITLPANLPIGGYLMKVSIIDQHASRIAETTVPLQIVAR